MSQSDKDIELPDVGTSDMNERIDWLLRQFVQEANARNAEFLSVTLNVGGSTISGTLVGASEYYKALSKIFIKDSEEPIEGTWGAYLLEVAKEAEDDSGKPEHALIPNYVHLRDARIHVNGEHPMPSNGGVWWRGKLSAVDGFWIGRLQVSSDDKDGL